MKTLKKVVDEIIYDLGESFNEVLYDVVKEKVLDLRALFLRRDAERNIENPIHNQSIVIPLQKVDALKSCVITDDCALLLRSVEKIPLPVRQKRHEIFASITTVDGKTILRHIDEVGAKFTKYNKYTKNNLAYSYENGYLYIHYNLSLKYIKVVDTFEDPREINTCADTTSCYLEDESPFPCSRDILVLIKQEILNKKQFLNKDDVEVNLTKDKEE